MPARGSIRRRLALTIVLMALMPVIVAIGLSVSLVDRTSERFFVPEIEAHLDHSLGVYQDLARSVKARMRHEATAIAAEPALRRAAAAHDIRAVHRELEHIFPQHPDLVSLSVSDADGEKLASRTRGRPVDARREFDLTVLRTLTSAPSPASPDAALDEGAGEDASGPMLEAVFATDRARFDERDALAKFLDQYRLMARRRKTDEASYIYAFAALLGLTIMASLGVGALLARSVTRRIRALSAATKRVGAGDLSIRVPEAGRDEIADLARAFNVMLEEVESSRARIEYLQRIGAWQEMARRLAHEIKNPLTPIQLAVQEIHRRYDGEDLTYRRLVDSTLEIVEDEVGTLRRLVTEFSSFARLPQANLQQADLAEFIAEQGERWSWLEGDVPEQPDLLRAAVDIEVPDTPAPVNMDRQMLRRALINLVRNAQQAMETSGRGSGRVRVQLRSDRHHWVINIDDDGPGIPEELRESVFDPYVTTKSLGTGLGLAIVKKIVIEHGGTVEALPSPLGGARLQVRLPMVGPDAGVPGPIGLEPSFRSARGPQGSNPPNSSSGQRLSTEG